MKKILVSAIVLLGATSLVFATGDYDKRGYKSSCDHSSYKSKCDYKKDYKKMDKYNKGGKNSYHKSSRYSHDKMFAKMFMALNLTKEQRNSIKDIFKSSRKNGKIAYKRASFSQFFKDGNFDKNAYVKAAQKRDMAMIEARAEKMSKIFAVLNKKQKEDLVILMKANEIKRASYKGKKYQKR